ncbi:toxin-antitoxin system YwqK family antitoxin [Pontimicrobium sp. IMCC45349]|uniref:toxin-antitoxin system YwqK family antitoxin n=1 Tax=Pontimicrobium sp. IMCC45349 TaxID=3391574 RepID=UPI0039A1082D
MKKCLLVLVVLFLSAPVFAQENNIKIEKKGDLTHATYYYDDGSIQQEGTFNAEGKLHGTWTSYDLQGNKLSVGNYINGVKTGKWLFWTANSLKEVDFVDSRIASVSEWNNKVKLAVRNR